MPRIIMLDGSVKHVTHAKAVEIKGYMDELPGYSIEDIQDPEKQKTVREFVEQVADIDASDIQTKDRPRKMNKPAVAKVLADTSLKGRAKFLAVLKAWKSGDS